jgi:uncharacterized protein YgiM (DUF1202 family)
VKSSLNDNSFIMKKIFLSIMFCMIAGFAFAQSYVVVAGDNVCLRYKPSESTKMMGEYAPHFNTGDTFSYYGNVGKYYKVGWNGDVYYLPMKYGRLRSSGGEVYNNSSSYSEVIIAGDNVCLRTQPSERTKILGSLDFQVHTGETYSYYGAVGNYYKIYCKGGYYYIPKKYGRLR